MRGSCTECSCLEWAGLERRVCSCWMGSHRLCGLWAHDFGLVVLFAARSLSVLPFTCLLHVDFGSLTPF